MFKIDLENKVMYILGKTSFKELHELIKKLNIDDSWHIDCDNYTIYYPLYPDTITTNPCPKPLEIFYDTYDTCSDSESNSITNATNYLYTYTI